MKTFIYMATAASALMAAGQAHAVTTFSASGNGFVIPLGVNTQTSTATVATAGSITSLTFSLDLLLHTSARDLTATVTHNGITAVLFSDLSTLRGLLGNYDFSSSGTTPLEDANGFLTFSPGTYSFTYALPGTSFIGTDSAGDWTLSITDDRRAGAGLLGSWSISGTDAAKTTAPVPEPATWAMMIAGFGAVGGALRRKKVKTTVSYAA